MPLDKPASESNLAELESVLNDHFEFKKLAEGKPTPAPEPEPVPLPPVPPPGPDASPSPKPEEPKPTQPEAQPEDLELDILKARLEETEARLAKQEKLAGRQAGEIGFKQQQKIRELEEEVERLQGRIAVEEDQPEPSPEPKRRVATRSMPDAATTYLVGMAVNNAGQAFFNAYPEAQELAPAMREYLTSTGQDVKVVLETNDPVEAARRTTMLFEEALQHAKYDRAKTRRSELETRRSDQIKGLDEAKRRATLSGSGSTSVAPIESKVATKRTLTELEADLASLDQRHGRRM